MVESSRPGYWSILGWIQWVTQVFPHRRTPVTIDDRLPAFREQDLPFATMGYAPAFFDATAYNSRPAVDWRAVLFLCTLPMLSAREAVIPLAGFTWGYRIASRGTVPTPYPLKHALGRDWNELRQKLVERHPKWRFAPRYIPRASTSR